MLHDLRYGLRVLAKSPAFTAVAVLSLTLGKTLVFNRHPFSVVGVAPRGFTGTFLGPGPAFWVPMSMHDVVQPNFDGYETRRGLFIAVVARLKPGVTVQQA